MSPARPPAVFAVMALLWSVAVPSMPGFVSGHLLKTWCDKNENLDREACYSYLRGASDAFHAVAAAAAAGAPGQAPPWPNRCMPARISIAALRQAFLEYAANHPEQLDRQAASLLAEILPAAFPCEPPEPETPANQQ